MTPQEVELVQASFGKVLPQAEAAAGLFYERLFEIAPHVRPYFRGNLRAQGAKLMTTLCAVVESLHDLDELMPSVRAMARRHVAYGVTPADYQPVGAALVHALSVHLGEEFTPDVRGAWLSAYADLSSEMIMAAYPPRGAEGP
ncbi:globin family protein [Poseidonocella sp. HB161398]|uniref:globin family protein n=1 Tax=Poseidonocella sp. HB161398 TaxID=2320855 RepID=UPI001107CD48|nr:globin family protein [Poseidonocella sp. HB161398]